MYVAGHGVDSNDYMKGDFSMTKMKKICIPVLAAAALAFSVPGTTQEAEASCNTYRVNVVTGYLALRTDTSYNSGNEIGELYSGDLVEVMENYDPAGITAINAVAILKQFVILLSKKKAEQE